MYKCFACSLPNSRSRTTCLACDEPLARPCLSCGTHNISNSGRCNLCGEPLPFGPSSHPPYALRDGDWNKRLPAPLNLVVAAPNQIPTWYEFKKDEIRIGKRQESDVYLPGDIRIDRNHAKIMVREGQYILLDLKSMDGTFVNGEKVETHRVVYLEDTIQIKEYDIRIVETYTDLDRLGIRFPGVSRPNEPAPPPRKDAIEFSLPYNPATGSYDEWLSTDENDGKK